MNSKVYLMPVIVFGMILSIILGLQSQWGQIAIVSSVIILFLSMLILGYILNNFFQKYNEKEILQQKYHDEYVKNLDSIKSENIKVIMSLDEHIKQYLKENNECINELLGTANILKNIVQEIDNEAVLLNKKIDNELIKIKNIVRTLEEMQDTSDEKVSAVQDIRDEIILLNKKIGDEYTKIDGIKKILDNMYEDIEDINIDDFTTFVKESKNFIDGLDSRLKEEREQNIELIKQALEQYQKVCDSFIRQSAGLNNEDIKLLKKISGELK